MILRLPLRGGELGSLRAVRCRGDFGLFLFFFCVWVWRGWWERALEAPGLLSLVVCVGGGGVVDCEDAQKVWNSEF